MTAAVPSRSGTSATHAILSCASGEMVAHCSASETVVIEMDIEALAKRAMLKPMDKRRLEPTDHDLAELERKLGVPLPPAYREFLQRFGASVFEGDVGFKPLQPVPLAVPSGRVTLDVLYGLSGNPNLDLRSANDRQEFDIPVGYAAIGHDAGANLLLLSKSGEIFYHDRDLDRLIPVARSFEDLLESFGEP